MEILEGIENPDEKPAAITEKAACEEKLNNHERAKELYE